MSESHCPSSPWPEFNSQPKCSILRDLSLANQTLRIRLESAWQKMAQSPLNGTTHGCSPTMDEWKKAFIWYAFHLLSEDSRVWARSASSSVSLSLHFSASLSWIWSHFSISHFRLNKARCRLIVSVIRSEVITFISGSGDVSTSMPRRNLYASKELKTLWNN